MYKVTDLAKRDIINITDGTKLGAVTDVHFDLATGKVLSIMVAPHRKLGIFSAGRELLVPWERIVKFGIDTVLVEMDSLVLK
ncbi:MAG: YlmC/YmxH family sporulation protein [Desulfotomaculum sp.]|nr:YlmC/YmxH family sporulation protein [Desulfotomaculum sp.]MCL0080934.1 YlmC/YmxH family sporulation protein [Peptococcaceae bacterium]